jgi:hypothetical protein
LRRLLARTSVLPMRVLVLSGVSLLLAAAGTAIAARHADTPESAVKIVVTPRFEEPSPALGPCWTLTFRIDPKAPLKDAKVEQLTNLSYDFQSRSPDIGEPHDGSVMFEHVPIAAGTSFKQRWCDYSGSNATNDIRVRVTGTAGGKRAFVDRTFRIGRLGESDPVKLKAGLETTDHAWYVHCANC